MTAANVDKNLSAQEQQILEMLLQGMNTSEISKRLSISYREVADMNNLIKIKLDVKSVDELRQVVGQR
jgi:DNA-binding CsgD family transcriptional regulator